MLILDRYLLRQMAKGYVGALVVMIAIMSLENAARLAAAVERTDRPLTLLARLMATLVPEYLGIAIPVATYLATVAAVRSLSLRGEWQMFGALGISSGRIMLMPMLLALASASVQLTVRLEFQPVGERSLDGLLSEIRRGLHGVPFIPGEVLTLDDGTTILSDVRRRREGGTLTNVFVRRGTDVASARAATLARDRAGGLVFELIDGTLIRDLAEDRHQAVTFERYRMLIPPARPTEPRRTDADRLDRLTARELIDHMETGGGDSPQAARALSALALRLSNAAFCLLLPWVALAFGSPPRRRIGGGAVLLGIVVIVIFMRSSALVEAKFLAAPILASVVHFAAWVLIVLAAVRYSQQNGEGTWDLALARMFGKIAPRIGRGLGLANRAAI